MHSTITFLRISACNLHHLHLLQQICSSMIFWVLVLSLTIPITLLGLLYFANFYKHMVISPSLYMILLCLEIWVVQHSLLRINQYWYLLNMTHTFLVDKGCSHYLWADTLLTSIDLNCLPSSPLGGEVPLHCVHEKCALFAFPWVFGYVAFVHDHIVNAYMFHKIGFHMLLVHTEEISCPN